MMFTFFVIFLLAVLLVLLLITVILLIAKKRKGALVADVILLIAAVFTFLVCLQYRNAYGWWFGMTEQVGKDHPVVSQMNASLMSYQFKIDVYTRSSDKKEIESAFKELRQGLADEDAAGKVYSHTISITFHDMGNKQSFITYNAVRSTDNTFNDWQVTDNLAGK